jgi:hypothetical protein
MSIQSSVRFLTNGFQKISELWKKVEKTKKWAFQLKLLKNGGQLKMKTHFAL